MNIKPPSFYRNNYYVTGEVYLVEYLTINGVRHREDGPALTELHRNGTVKRVTYIVNGLTHRIDGPAILHCDEDGNITVQRYIVNDIEVTETLREAGIIDEQGNCLDQTALEMTLSMM